jgi:ribose/xylose/arabinose/galactoside ABC-type transport system permease subunit
VRTVTAWVLLLGALVGWPASMLTLARNEPPFVLSLSWLAIVIEASSLLTASQVHENQDASDE